MKYLFFAIQMFLTTISFAQQPYIIKGKLKNTKEFTKVYASHKLGKDFVKDSATITNGLFTLKGNIDEPTLLYLSIKKINSKPAKADMLQAFIEPGIFSIIVNDSFNNAKITGSQAYNDFALMQKTVKPAMDKLDKLYKEYEVSYKEKNTDRMKILEKDIEDVENGELATLYTNFFNANIKSKVALTALDRIAGYDVDYDKIAPLFNQLPKTTKETLTGIAFAKKLDIAKLTKIGAVAPLFTQNDVNDKPVNLSDFKGKYVLVDFWASWCGPCRQENPNVVANYNKYKDNNFTVLGVSLDRTNQKEKWLKAIDDDKLAWTHVSDLKFWQNEVAVLYGIQAIPQNLLIDPNGIIIGKNLREEKLSEKLATLFNK